MEAAEDLHSFSEFPDNASREVAAACEWSRADEALSLRGWTVDGERGTAIGPAACCSSAGRCTGRSCARRRDAVDYGRPSMRLAPKAGELGTRSGVHIAGVDVRGLAVGARRDRRCGAGGDAMAARAGAAATATAKPPARTSRRTEISRVAIVMLSVVDEVPTRDDTLIEVRCTGQEHGKVVRSAISVSCRKPPVALLAKLCQRSAHALMSRHGSMTRTCFSFVELSTTRIERRQRCSSRWRIGRFWSPAVAVASARASRPRWWRGRQRDARRPQRRPAGRGGRRDQRAGRRRQRHGALRARRRDQRGRGRPGRSTPRRRGTGDCTASCTARAGPRRSVRSPRSTPRRGAAPSTSTSTARMYVLKHSAREMVRGGGGSFVGISSIASSNTHRWFGAYGAEQGGAGSPDAAGRRRTRRVVGAGQQHPARA